MTKENNAVILEPQGRRIICPIHGDIGSKNGLGGNTALFFTIGGENVMFCLTCIKEEMLKRFPQCHYTPQSKKRKIK